MWVWVSEFHRAGRSAERVETGGSESGNGPTDAELLAAAAEGVERIRERARCHGECQVALREGLSLLGKLAAVEGAD